MIFPPLPRPLEDFVSLDNRVARNRRALDMTAETRLDLSGAEVKYEGRHVKTEKIDPDRIARAMKPPGGERTRIEPPTPPPAEPQPTPETAASTLSSRILNRIRRNLSRRHR